MPIDILIVDDSAAIRKILQRVIAQADVPVSRVFEAGDGQEALRALDREHIGLVLTDINMPNMDGIELLSAIRAREEWRYLPVLMITTEGSQSKVMEAAELGANGYVRKPFTPEQIKEKLAAMRLQ